MPSTKTLRRQQKARRDTAIAAAATAARACAVAPGNTNPTTTTSPPPPAAASKNPLPRKLKAMPPLKRAKMERLKKEAAASKLKAAQDQTRAIALSKLRGGLPIDDVPITTPDNRKEVTAKKSSTRVQRSTRSNPGRPVRTMDKSDVYSASLASPHSCPGFNPHKKRNSEVKVLKHGLKSLKFQRD